MNQLILREVITVKNVQFVTIGFLIMGLSFNIFAMLCLNTNDIAFPNVEGVDYCFIIHNISKFEAISLLENFVLDDRGYI